MCSLQRTVLHPSAELLADPQSEQIHPLGRPVQLLDSVGRNQSET